MKNVTLLFLLATLVSCSSCAGQQKVDAAPKPRAVDGAYVATTKVSSGDCPKTVADSLDGLVFEITVDPTVELGPWTESFEYGGDSQSPCKVTATGIVNVTPMTVEDGVFVIDVDCPGSESTEALKCQHTYVLEVERVGG